MSERVAIVTGGARRVGRAMVERLATDGFRVLFTYLSSAAQAAEIERSVPGTKGVRADLTQPVAARDAIASALAAFSSRLDLLVNSASIYAPATSAAEEIELLRRLNAIHVESPLLLSTEFAPLLRQSRGHIVNMLDLLAEKPWPRLRAYCASKAAMWNLTLSLAKEFAPEVTVNGIAPGVVEWPSDYPMSEREAYLKRVPLARAGTPQDVAAVVHFFATGGGYITGQIIRLDGGRSIT